MQTGDSAPSDKNSVAILCQALEQLEKGFTALPAAVIDVPGAGRMPDVVRQLAERLQDNYPYFHPLYAGQMLKPPHPIAWLAWALAMWINPNNHALDGGRATSALEKEAVAGLAGMLGWVEHLGHLTSGGTMANLEALWVAGRLAPGKTIVASAQAHYTHQRLCQVLQLPFERMACDSAGRLDLAGLESRLGEGNVGTVVATIGTTACGAVDPLPELLQLQQKHGFRLHADAAYGGYFVLADNLRRETRRSLDHLCEADSVVIDPHKHGLQPYGCGCVLFADSSVGRFYKHDSPYTYFSSTELHLGEISLECSRPGAAAAGLWATQQLLPLVRGGEFGRMLSLGREAALRLYERLRGDTRFVTAFAPELDIVIWTPRARTLSAASRQAQRIFEAAARRNLHLALATVPAAFFGAAHGMEPDAGAVRCLRSVLMKPEHSDWLDRIWQLLDDATNAAKAEAHP